MTKKHEQPKKDELDIIDGEIVAEFDSQTLLNLPKIEDEEPGIEDTKPGHVVDPGRRRFIGRMLLGGTTALALGGSAALWYSQRNSPQVVVLPNGTDIQNQPTTSDVEALIQRVAELEGTLQAVSSERNQLQLDLDASNSALSDANELLQLWQSHDNIGLDDIISAGLTALADLFSGALAVAGLVGQGLEAMRIKLDNFIKALPGPVEGIDWLKTQIDDLADDLQWLDQQVEDVVESVDPLASKVAEFVLWLLDRLPFGYGDRAKASLEAMQNVITNLPETVSGINDSVLDPLAEWFGDKSDRNLTGLLLSPMETLVIAPARNLIDDFTALESSYHQQLASPVLSALEQRSELRSQIQTVQARIDAHEKVV